MALRQTSGAIVCPSCGKLVGVRDDRCWNCGRPHPGMWGWAPLLRRLGRDLGFVQIVMWGCGLLYVAALLTDRAGIQSFGLALLSPSPASLIVWGASGVEPVVVYGRWWTFLSAGWLHGGILHILFNMLWVRQLAPVTAQLYGPGRTVVLYTLSSVTGFVLSTFGPRVPLLGGRASLTVGASAAIFGLLGALVYAGRRGAAISLGRQAWSYAVVLFAFGLLFPGVDNWAHLGGFGGGFLLARWLDPLAPERGDHLLAGLACLAATVAAVGASVATVFL